MSQLKTKKKDPAISSQISGRADTANEKLL